ncbi:MAG TPA: CpsB/CapC family capsule biosynthesis tyrosine phosphatase, partial [Candidatus Polarisedimenticolia bacterium]|nr:CpsB/CapC family capsule biosynthesis tyrosine phosphatase [Candidatus Polarisedimenticolia bacterium]
MIDLHNHLLPGIDDGAKKVEETLEFLRIARRDGVTTIVATPHMKPGVYDNRRETILERVSMVREAAKGDEAEGVTLLPGAEVYFTADLTARARAGELMTIGDG